MPGHQCETMTTLSFRVLVASLFSVIAYVLYEIHFLTIDLPDMALSYIRWWRSQPMNSLQQLTLQYGMLTHAVLLLSLVGVGFLWSPARYVFTVTMLLSIFREALWSIPLVVIGRHILFDNLIVLMSGMLIVAMFFTPLRHQFVNNPLAKKPA